MKRHRMSFGKHKGEAIADLPDEYLEWLLDNVEISDPRLRAALFEEADRRRAADDEGDRQDRQPFVDRLNAPRPEVAEELIGAGVRSLARKYHPDVAGGGDSRRMVELNGAADWLRRQVRAIA